MRSKATPTDRRSAPKGRGRTRRLGFWALVALVVHLEAVVAFVLWGYFYAPRNDELDMATIGAGEEAVELSMIDDGTARKMIAEMEQEAQKKEEEEIKKEVEQKETPGQVVELARPRNEERPKDAKFAAEFDSKVDKQTKKFGELQKDAQSGASNGADRVSMPANPASQPSPAQPAKPGQTSQLLAMRAPGPAGSPERQPLPGTGPQNLSGQSDESEAGPKPGDGREQAMAKLEPLRAPGGGAPPGSPGSPGSPALVPSVEQVAHAIGSGTQDHIDDVDDGDETALNAKKWKFASFFNRVKRQVRDQWRPAEEYRKRDPTFRIFGMRDRFTLLRVSIKPDGALASVGLETGSGIDFLDDVAVEAFKLAQPFPNPPRQLVEDSSGLISFRFGFYFEIGGGGASPKMKVFKYSE
jgi:TonB family protein